MHTRSALPRHDQMQLINEQDYSNPALRCLLNFVQHVPSIWSASHASVNATNHCLLDTLFIFAFELGSRHEGSHVEAEEAAQ